MTPKKKRPWEQAFIKTLAQTANVHLSCHAAEVSRQMAYKKREADPEFAALWDQAIEDACDLLEATALQRAKAGSDTLLIFLLKAYRASKFRETVRNEHTGAGGGPINFQVVWPAVRTTLMTALADFPDARAAAATALLALEQAA